MNSSIVVQRLYNQRIEGKRLSAPRQLVAYMGAVQGQEYQPFAKWALGMRLSGATHASVERAFNDGEILRTHVLRPTWHFVTPQDIGWLIELTAPRVHAAMAYGYRQAGLERTLARKSNAVIERALRGGNQLIRPELRAVLEKAGVAVETAHRMSFFMMWAELDGVVCSGALRGNEFTYMLLEERAPDAKSLARDEAVTELARRFFASHGPATVNDFAWWSGLTTKDARAGLEALGSKVKSQVIDRKEYWSAPHDTKVPVSKPTAHLLPVLDEYIVAYRDASIIYASGLEKQAANRNFVSSVELDGRIIGEWKPIKQVDKIIIELELYKVVSAAERGAVETAAEDYAEFFGKEAILQEKTLNAPTGKGRKRQ